MITQLRIQNFKSLRDVTLDLQRVNLLIGPNNCGKTNVLKALKFFSEFLDGEPVTEEQVANHNWKGKRGRDDDFLGFYPEPINLYITSYPNQIFPIAGEFFGGVCIKILPHALRPEIEVAYELFVTLSEKIIPVEEKVFNITELNHYCDSLTAIYSNARSFLPDSYPPDYEDITTTTAYNKNHLWFNNHLGMKSVIHDLPVVPGEIRNLECNAILDFCKDVQVYSPLPTSLTNVYPIQNEDVVTDDAANLIAFLLSMRNKHHAIYKRILTDLNRFIPEFTEISFEIVEVPKDDIIRKQYGDYSFAKLGLVDRYNQTFWAEDLSEGILYFLSLLAIIHQPKPPKLLLLEEPEKGIHPRRIREVLDLIFELAEEKDIQVIMTTHSPLVVDRFSDIPESVFILEKPENETIVKNLQRDVIEPMNEKFREAGEEPIPYTEALGEHWAMGFLGGVPNV